MRARDELRALIGLAAPLMLGQGGIMLMGVVDTMVIGRSTPLDMAGVALGNGVVSAITVFGLGLSMGIEPLSAQAFGAGERAAARTWMWQGVWLALMISGPLIVLALLAPLTFASSGISPELASTATRYIYGRLPSIPMVAMMAALRAYRSSTGGRWSILLAVGTANVINLLLCLALVFGWAGLPKLGALGTALATSSASVGLVLVLAIAIRIDRLSAEDAAQVVRRPEKARIRRVFSLGWPIGAHGMAETGVFVAVAWAIGATGETLLAAHSVAVTLASLTFMMALGIANAATARVGMYIGRGEGLFARRAGFYAIALGAVFMGTAGLGFQLAPDALASLFTPEPAVIAASLPLVVIAGVFALSDGIQGVASGALRGAGDTAWPFWTNLVAHWLVGLPVGWWLATRHHLGPSGYWWGLTAGLTVVALVLFTRFAWLSRRPIARLSSDESGAP